MKSEKAKTHLGERKMMNCGEEVEIVNYYNYTDIDVRFPDGYVMNPERLRRTRLVKVSEVKK